MIRFQVLFELWGIVSHSPHLRAVGKTQTEGIVCTSPVVRQVYGYPKKMLTLVHSFFSSCGGLRFLRMDSTRMSTRSALCTRLSRMPSAMVGSPMCSCQRETGNWEVRMVERVW